MDKRTYFFWSISKTPYVYFHQSAFNLNYSFLSKWLFIYPILLLDKFCAFNLKKQGISRDLIAQCTGLTFQEIELL